MTDQKGVSLAILGVVAVIAVVGLVLLFSGAKTGRGVSSVDRGQWAEANRFVSPVPGAAASPRDSFDVYGDQCPPGRTLYASGARYSGYLSDRNCVPASDPELYPEGLCCR